MNEVVGVVQATHLVCVCVCVREREREREGVCGLVSNCNVALKTTS